ncbi:uncharacterized protein LOC110043150 [Orbicella faveolata]|uniref:uncharacterized protein LOC110043150 n=1 Tax=Orbicella faveolata TaxID=48498 RepID=UPI0009E4C55D|nr:uncharacterized protein LOC110043150 [Orbicella faveolata]
MPLVPVIPLFVFLDVLESNIIPCNYKHNYHHDIMFKTLKNLKHFTFLNTAVQNRNIGIAVAFSVVGVVAGAVAMWFYMRRKSAKPKPQRFGFDGVEEVKYSGGEMMYTNPAYSTLGDEGVITFSKDKLNNASG